MGIIGWIILGLVAGAIAKALHKGDEPGGILGTMVVGIRGGLIASAAGIGALGSFFDIGTWLVAIGGAFLLLVVYNAITAGSGRTTAHAR